MLWLSSKCGISHFKMLDFTRYLDKLFNQYLFDMLFYCVLALNIQVKNVNVFNNGLHLCILLRT